MIGDAMVQAWTDSGRSYGAPRLVPDVNEILAPQGIGVGNRRARRLMRSRGITGQSRRRWRPLGTTRRDPAARPAPDLLNRDFTGSSHLRGERRVRMGAGWVVSLAQSQPPVWSRTRSR